MKEEITKSIRNLPVLPDTIAQIQKICNDPESGINDIIKIVSHDPILTVHLLRAANSPLYGFSREVTNINQAISLFGMSTIKGFAIAAAVKSRVKMNLSPYGLNEHQFLHVADSQNAFMVRWMSQVDRKLLDVLTPASFLLEIGIVVFSNILIDQGKQQEFILLLDNKQNPHRNQLERDIFGMSSYEVTSELFEYWHFDKLLCDVIKYTEKPEQAPEKLKKYAYALAILQRLISLYQSCTPTQIDQAKAILLKSPFNEALFDRVLHDFLKSVGE